MADHNLGLTANHGLRTRIAHLLRGSPGASTRSIRDLGNSEAIDQAVAGMVGYGHVTVETAGATHKHYLTELGQEGYL